MKLFLIATLLLATTSAARPPVSDIVQAMLPYCTHGQMRREVKAAIEECSASCSSDETATDGYYDATTGGYEATTGGYYWDETSPAGYYYDNDGNYDATTDGDYDGTTGRYHYDEATTDGYYWDDNDGYYDATTDGYYNVRSLSDRNYRKMFRRECPTTHYMLNKFYGRDLSDYKVLDCVEQRMNGVLNGEVLRSGAALRYGCGGAFSEAGGESGAAVRSGCEEISDCIYRINGQIEEESDWCSAGLDVFPMVAAMCNSIAFMDSCFDHMHQQFVEANGYMDQTTTPQYVPDGYAPVRG